ncbi:MAG: TIGR03545 family protein [Candidatus Cloacimonetes bacterium]|nr:TIGR03545 family protein [Candidatus Cloacimonadota bacterium]
MKKFFKRFFGFIFILILLIVLVVGTLFIFRNQIATMIIEKGGSAINGAKVEVDNVNLKPLEMHISWDKIQVTDKKDTWQNLFETEKCEFYLAFKPLLAKKILIENMQISNVTFDTKRETDGKFPQKPKKTKPKKPSKLMNMVKKNLEEEKSKIPIFNPKQLQKTIDVDSLMTILNLKTPAKVDSLKKIAEDRYSHWDNRIKNNDYEKEVNLIKKNLEKINVNKIKTIPQLETQLSAATTAYTKANKLYNNAKKDKSDLEKDLKMLKELKKDIPIWIKSDYETALNLAKLPDFSVENIALMLFGDKITAGILKGMEAIEKSRELAKNKPVQSPKAEVKPKPEKMLHLPNFWIKKIDLSVTGKDNLKLSGNISNISSDQKRSKKPMKFEFSGKQKQIGDMNITAIFDYQTNVSKENINLSVKELPFRELKLSNFELLPKKMKKGDASLNSNISITENKISTTINFIAKNIEFDYKTQPKMNKDLTRIARSITEAIDTITFDALMEQTEERFKFKVDSNLDNLIASQMKKVISNEIARAKQEIRKRIEKELAKYKKELDKLIAQKEKELRGEIAKIQSKIDKEMVEVNKKKKEIEDKINAEKKKIQDKIDAEKKKAEDKINKEIDKKKDELEDKLKDLWG